MLSVVPVSNAYSCNTLETACVGVHLSRCGTDNSCLEAFGGHYSVPGGTGKLEAVVAGMGIPGDLCVMDPAQGLTCETYTWHDMGSGAIACGEAVATTTPLVGDPISEKTNNYYQCVESVLALLRTE